LETFYPFVAKGAGDSNPADSAGSYPGYELREGCNSQGVGVIKAWLNKIGGIYDNIPLISVGGNIFGAETAAAVKAFQKAFNLVEDGIVGKTTWHKAAQIHDIVARVAEVDGKLKEAPRAETLAPAYAMKVAPKGSAMPTTSAGMGWTPRFSGKWDTFGKNADNETNLSESWWQPMFYENDFAAGQTSPIAGKTGNLVETSANQKPNQTLAVSAQKAPEDLCFCQNPAGAISNSSYPVVMDRPASAGSYSANLSAGTASGRAPAVPAPSGNAAVAWNFGGNITEPLFYLVLLQLLYSFLCPVSVY
jgi:hypothetical protein